MHFNAPIFTNAIQAAELAAFLRRLTQSEDRLIARRAARLAADLTELADPEANIGLELSVAMDDAQRLVTLAQDRGSRADLYAARTVHSCVWIHLVRAGGNPAVSGT
jgi:hypothetical protein